VQFIRGSAAAQGPAMSSVATVGAPAGKIAISQKKVASRQHIFIFLLSF